MTGQVGDISSLLESPLWVSRIISRTARDDSRRVDISPAQKKGIPEGILVSQVWGCLERARIIYGPIVDSLGNANCHLQHGEGSDQIQLSVSIYMGEGGKWDVAVLLVWDT